MKLINLILVLALAPLICFSQKRGEFSIHLTNGILLNSLDVSRSGGESTYSKISDTYRPAVGGSYTYVFPFGLLISGGVDFGYQQYRVKVDYPFALMGFKQPKNPSSVYPMNEIIPFAQARLSTGYRFKAIGKIQP